ncbi:hypothetical protein TIFTF001_019492 [Ficus carica]|uniref:Uncharacterized protein n=1 Tax=Ficus carica TaxID=3494 RepID=A0AA88AGI6_FICCA|nr:hypothetical protein TIFTF001_019492 [Ficus carica]
MNGGKGGTPAAAAVYGRNSCGGAVDVVLRQRWRKSKPRVFVAWRCE